MKTKSFFITIVILIIAMSSEAQETGTFTDSRDGKTYKTIKLGNQEWLTENLNVTQFRNGEPIWEANSKDKWKLCRDSCIACWCKSESVNSKGIIYGILYNYWAVIDSNGLCPSGWHVPNDNEFLELTIYFGGRRKAKKMAKINKSDFAGIVGGYRNHYGEFNRFNTGYWWTVGLPENAHRSIEAILLIIDNKENWKTNQQYVVNQVWYRSMKVNWIEMLYNYGSFGMSVRCVKDKENQE